MMCVQHKLLRVCQRVEGGRGHEMMQAEHGHPFATACLH
jgi:hypothetical protein